MTDKQVAFLAAIVLYTEELNTAVETEPTVEEIDLFRQCLAHAERLLSLSRSEA